MTYQYTDMSQAQIEEFLQAPRFAIVGTNRVNGPPQLTPVWYLYENSRIYVTMFMKSAKFRNLRRDPHIGICIAGENPDARAVMIYGTAKLIQEDNAWVNEIRWRLVRRYHDGDEQAQSFMDSEAMAGERALAVVTPDKVIAQDFN
jgi:PPOX class probable F420-dependent enzyme